MVQHFRSSCQLMAVWALAWVSAGVCHAENTRVLMKTSMGDLTIELFDEQAPITTKNFISYVESGFYDGTIFHRVINDFVIQGGGFTKEMKQKETQRPIKNEATNGLKNEKYTLSMARTQDPSSATSQFFINLKDNESLDRAYRFGDGYGYAVFGKIVAGQDVIDKIRQVATTTVSLHEDVPTKPIVIEKAEIVAADKP
jgi:cyclophilin family peptidyl-prolyl cis-trans isomerase